MEKEGRQNLSGDGKGWEASAENRLCLGARDGVNPEPYFIPGKKFPALLRRGRSCRAGPSCLPGCLLRFLFLPSSIHDELGAEGNSHPSSGKQ